MDRGFQLEETEGLFNKNTSERVSSNLGHISQIGRLTLIGRGRSGCRCSRRRRHGRETEEVACIFEQEPTGHDSMKQGHRKIEKINANLPRVDFSGAEQANMARSMASCARWQLGLRGETDAS